MDKVIITPHAFGAVETAIAIDHARGIIITVRGRVSIFWCQQNAYKLGKLGARLLNKVANTDT